MTFGQETATHMIDFMLFLNARTIEKTTDKQKKAELEADRRDMTIMQAQIRLGRRDAIDSCFEKYGAAIKLAMENESGIN